MRFNDMIATVLEQDEQSALAAIAKWRQLVDLVAQRRGPETTASLEEALAWLRAHRPSIPLMIRIDAARALGGRRVAPVIIALFGEDHPSVASPLFASARLEAEEWLDLLPRIGPVGRALLRHRRDLAPEIINALGSFGASDFALPGTVAGADPEAMKVRAAPQEPDAGRTNGGQRHEAQIQELVDRIEAFRRDREAAPRPKPPEQEQVQEFRWETGPDGIVLWVEDAPRGPLIGQTIATPAERSQYGVDGQAAGAYEKRAPFRDARLSIAGSGAASGDWRISGVPFFDPLQGSFLGYRGSARRPRLDEVARPEGGGEGGVFGTEFPADALRQLIHELRTPLNAIVGFAEMIDGQYMGPAAGSYRARAAEIMEQANRLLSAVDDLDTAARIETSRLTVEQSPVDASALLHRLHEAFERIAIQRNAHIALEIAPHLPHARVELNVAERMMARLLAATTGLACEGETLAASMGMERVGQSEMICLAIDRPSAIAGLEEKALLDPGYSPEGDWPGAPALGLGFALRLVRNLAEAVGGALDVGERRFFLYLPPLEAQERVLGNGS
ncbi:sensor histidine kinase [Sphingosinicella rhizophila]|uniref:histidine kinase n=1 Tax=Sphingosinicella rhizophila TaxID=3050082 RepID=A0ABU3Q2M6_9SPHN|nr:histidine kinase dimerization/phospho-acceptor domain-containing protein [Sphingosinicella sp. GR2756]MDT9597638.1 histidine kinase dimerization/phospho-acceptor domain-containing protein [Sphingosinicella sp. GR2756]